MRLAFLFFSAALLSACASGSYILTGVQRTPIDPSLVRLYADPPVSYETIAIVKAASGAGWTEQGDTDYAIQELKSQAAKLGANGIILTGTGDINSTSYGTNSDGSTYSYSSTAQRVSGRAIYVTE